jgi:hypothetical protein
MPNLSKPICEVCQFTKGPNHQKPNSLTTAYNNTYLKKEKRKNIHMDGAV